MIGLSFSLPGTSHVMSCGYEQQKTHLKTNPNPIKKTTSTKNKSTSSGRTRMSRGKKKRMRRRLGLQKIVVHHLVPFHRLLFFIPTQTHPYKIPIRRTEEAIPVHHHQQDRLQIDIGTFAGAIR